MVENNVVQLNSAIYISEEGDFQIFKDDFVLISKLYEGVDYYF